jgi:hypothetical protein
MRLLPSSLVIGCCVLALAVAPSTGATAPARLQVSADEFTLVLSRPAIRAGVAVVEIVNYGEDEHDLVLRRLARGALPLRVKAVRPDRARSLETRLRPGRYALWCSLGDHRARGMVARLVVTPR